MMKRLVCSILAAAALAAPVSALGAEEKDKKAKDVGQYIDLQPVAMPIVVDGRLVNYVFVYVRENLKPSADVIKLRDKEPLFRDALVRDAHRTPFVLATDWQKVDEAKLVAAMTRDAAAIAPGDVASVKVTQQTPQKRVMPPRPASPDKP